MTIMERFGDKVFYHDGEKTVLVPDEILDVALESEYKCIINAGGDFYVFPECKNITFRKFKDGSAIIHFDIYIFLITSQGVTLPLHKPDVDPDVYARAIPKIRDEYGLDVRTTITASDETYYILENDLVVYLLNDSIHVLPVRRGNDLYIHTFTARGEEFRLFAKNVKKATPSPSSVDETVYLSLDDTINIRVNTIIDSVVEYFNFEDPPDEITSDLEVPQGIKATKYYTVSKFYSHEIKLTTPFGSISFTKDSMDDPFIKMMFDHITGKRKINTLKNTYISSNEIYPNRTIFETYTPQERIVTAIAGGKEFYRVEDGELNFIHDNFTINNGKLYYSGIPITRNRDIAKKVLSFKDPEKSIFPGWDIKNVMGNSLIIYYNGKRLFEFAPKYTQDGVEYTVPFEEGIFKLFLPYADPTKIDTIYSIHDVPPGIVKEQVIETPTPDGWTIIIGGPDYTVFGTKHGLAIMTNGEEALLFQVNRIRELEDFFVTKLKSTFDKILPLVQITFEPMEFSTDTIPAINTMLRKGLTIKEILNLIG